MLVLQPNKRITIEQIKRNRWMTVEVVELPILDGVNIGVGGTAAFEPNDQILRIMHNLGIDAQRARESLKVSISSKQLYIMIEINSRLLLNRQTAMIIIPPSICFFWSELRTKKTLWCKMVFQNIFH